MDEKAGRVSEGLSRIAGWLLAGVGAGALAAFTLVRANPSIVGAHDALVIVAWLGAIYGAAMAVGGAAVALAQRVVRRVARRAPLAGGVSFPGALIEAWLFLAITVALHAAAVALELPHTVSFAAAAVVAFAATLFFGGGRIGALRRLERGAAMATLLLFVAASTGAALRARRPAPAQAQPFDIGEPGRRVFLIGVDGAEWRKIDALVAAGRLPTFARLIQEGVRAPLSTRLPTWSPRLWTTIATGCAPEVHGVLDFTETPVPGLERGIQRLRKTPLLPRLGGVAELVNALFRGDLLHEVPVTACHRRVPALWNVLSDHGRRVAVVNWFATWPAEPVNGALVSDNNPSRAAFLMEKHQALSGGTTGLTHPAGLMQALAKLPYLDPGDDPAAILAQPFFEDLSDPERQRLAAQPGWLHTFHVIQTSDAFAAAAADHLVESEAVDLLMLYLSGVDNVSHRSFREPRIVDRYYEFTDSLLRRLVARADERTTVLLVSDHGWEYDDAAKIGHEHAPDGVFLAWGAGVRGPAVLPHKPTIDDVAPTVLALLGFPRSAEMDGAPILEALPSDLRTGAATKTIRSFGPYLAPARPADTTGAVMGSLQEERLNELRALGYVK